MKIRTDFVTNSSSSCFVIHKYSDVEKIKEILTQLIDAHNKITGQNIDINKICIITNSKDREYINQLFENEYWDGEDCINCYLSHEERVELDYPKYCNCSKKTEKCKTYTDAILSAEAAIFGYDNAIPYELHDSIHWYLGAKKYHLG